MADGKKLAVLEGYHYIAVEGPIGAGKTSLAKALAQRFSARLVLEPAAKNPFLERFYGDMRRYALPTQLVFLVSRYQQQGELKRRYLFHPMVVSDYTLARDRIFAGLTLNEEEFRLYEQLYEVMTGHAARPDIVVLLQADTETLMGRIRRRGVPYEADLGRDYLEQLNAAYTEYFRLYAESPLLIIDTNAADYSKGGLDLARVVEEIEQTQSGRRRYVAEGTG